MLSVLGSLKHERKGPSGGLAAFHPHVANRNTDRQSERPTPPLPGRRITNAERFAQGLPPLPPRRLYKPAPSRQQPHRARASNVALGEFRIHVYDSKGLFGTSQGYVGSNVDSSGHYPLVGDAASGVVAIYDNSGAITNTAVTGDHPYLGFVNPAGNTNDNSKEGGWLSATRYAPPGSGPVQSTDGTTLPGGSKDTYETAVWTIGSGNELIASWYDTTGGVHSMVLLLVLGNFLLVDQVANPAPNTVRFFAEAV
ncbi:hypothetical protein FRB90_002239 [Tulasnella sp. 427]|nr:hypothetical protein FRB90_002239 [Tulasnella sp. 427]